MPIVLERSYRFAAAHRYYRPEWSEEENLRTFGKCAFAPGHGHNYRLQVVVTGKPSPRDGMIMDFEEIRKKTWELALNQCDHHTLNDFLENPTAENVIVWIWDRLKPQLPQLKELRLWETPEYCVTYSAD